MLGGGGGGGEIRLNGISGSFCFVFFDFIKRNLFDLDLVRENFL